jgi:ketosteroid isomerase-like protein
MTIPNRYQTPLAAISALVGARAAGDVDGTVMCYEDTATVVTGAGQSVTGRQAIRITVERFLALNPVFTITARALIESAGVCLHHSRWTLTGTTAAGEPLALAGTTADVIRQQPDGGWLVALDNPWGGAYVT